LSRQEAPLRREGGELLTKAAEADTTNIADDRSLSELELREVRLKMRAEARADEHYERERAQYEARLAASEAKIMAAGRKLGGHPPRPPEGPLPKDQLNLTDEASRIMPVSGGGIDWCDNAQTAVAMSSTLVAATDGVQAANDKQPVEPTLDELGALKGERGACDTLLAGAGYDSAANVNAYAAARVRITTPRSSVCARRSALPTMRLKQPTRSARPSVVSSSRLRRRGANTPPPCGVAVVPPARGSNSAKPGHKPRTRTASAESSALVKIRTGLPRRLASLRQGIG
jgi:hypothetical protein